MEAIKALVERYKARGYRQPRRERDAAKRAADPDLNQESKDAIKLKNLKYMEKNSPTESSQEIYQYLDEHAPGWRGADKVIFDHMMWARDIVQRYRERGNVLPKRIYKNADSKYSQEYTDCAKLQCWKAALRGEYGRTCPEEVREYLDQNMPEWREGRSNKKRETRKSSGNRMDLAMEIVGRYKERGCVLPTRKKPTEEPSSQLEFRDADILHNWKQWLRGRGGTKCSDEVRDYLDENLPHWRDTQLDRAKGIIRRCEARDGALPKTKRHQLNKVDDPDQREELLQESRDKSMLYEWKMSLLGRSRHILQDEVRIYLDLHLPHWRGGIESTLHPVVGPLTQDTTLDFHMTKAREVVARYNERGGILPVAHNYYKKSHPKNPALDQEFQDNNALRVWRAALRGHGECPPEVFSYLDEHMPLWRLEDAVTGNKSKKRKKSDRDEPSTSHSSSSSALVGPPIPPASGQEEHKLSRVKTTVPIEPVIKVTRQELDVMPPLQASDGGPVFLV